MRKANLFAPSILAAACFPVVASGQTILFSENFDNPGAETRFTQHTSANAGAVEFMVDYHYDYGSFQYLLFPQGPQNPPTFQPIPPAPGGATTRGLKISVNDSIGQANTFQIIPNGVNPGSDFRLEFDMWLNYNGGALGGTGSTETMVVGLNTEPGGAGIIGPSPAAFDPPAVSGYAFTAAGEGGGANDYRAYDRGDPIDDGPNFPKVNATWPTADEFRFDRDTGELILTTAGAAITDRPSNHFNSYYDEVFPGDTIGGGTFETRGAPGKNWVPVVVEQRGNEITFWMNDKLITTLFRAETASGVPELGYTDEFNSVANPNIDNFALYDNIVITQLAAPSRFTATSGNYTNGANWNGPVPNGANEKADFGGAPGAANVTVDSAVTLRSIVFSSPDTYTVGGTGPINMTSESNTLMTNAGSHVINAPINSQGHLSVFNQDGTTLRVTNLTHEPTKAFGKTGTGTFEVNEVRAKNITVTGGTLKLLPGGVSRTGRLDLLNSTSKLDLTTSPVIIDYVYREAVADPTINTNPIQNIITEILTGFNGGDWQGIGIYSSDAQAQPNTYAVGYLDNGEVGLTTYLGEAVDDSTVIIRGTRRGDADLNGIVNLGDFNRLAANFGATDAEWWEGDFNYDRLVNLADFNSLAANFGQQAGPDGPTPDDWANLAAAIPEPGSATLLGIGALALVRRRRRA